jgi:hypothetical protein
MRWLVEAADTKTGQETEITVEALTEADAERLARYNGLLVSKVYKAGRKTPPLAPPPPVVPYAKPDPAVIIGSGPPEFTRLVRQARATRNVGLAVSVCGWSVVAICVGAFGYRAARDLWGDWGAWWQWLPGDAAQALPTLALGAGGVALGSLLRLLSSMALVLRAAARQAHRPALRPHDSPGASASEAVAASGMAPAATPTSGTSD